MKTLNAIIDFLFGKKHYIVIITRVGQEDKGYMTHSDIWDTYQEAEDCMYRIATARIFNAHFIQSFRSHKNYVYQTEEKPAINK